jgi:hypothetical protein
LHHGLNVVQSALPPKASVRVGTIETRQVAQPPSADTKKRFIITCKVLEGKGKENKHAFPCKKNNGCGRRQPRQPLAAHKITSSDAVTATADSW